MEISNQNSAEEKIKSKINALHKKFILGVIISAFTIPSIMIYFHHEEINLRTEANKTSSINSLSELEKITQNQLTSENVIKLSASYINNGMAGKAGTILNQYIKKDSTNAIVYNNLGTANIILKNYKMGINACRKAISLDPNFQLAKNNLNWGLDELRKLNQSKQQLLQIPTSKKDQAIYLNLGLNYFQSGEYDSSIMIWNEGLLKYPDNTTSFLNNIGTSLVMLKHYSKAIDAFNKVLAVDTNNQLAMNNISWAKADSVNSR
jgi:tetratricopeptide (TPR) repeat protein